jgi:hypothetical protein
LVSLGCSAAGRGSAGRGAGVSGASGVTGSVGAATDGFEGGAGRGGAGFAPSAGDCWRAATSAAEVSAAGFAVVDFFADFFADALPSAFAPPAPSVAKDSLSLRTTGASTVDDADRTNSPSSWSLAMTALLSIPNSLASS